MDCGRSECTEHEPNIDIRVKISKSMYEGLEFFKRSGATNMLDRPTVLNLAKEWNFNETADWIESVDRGVYGRLIMYGPDSIGEESLDEKLERMDSEYDDERRTFWESTETPEVPAKEESQPEDDGLHEAVADSEKLARLVKRAALVIADSYETKESGVLISEWQKIALNPERTQLMQNLAEAASTDSELHEAIWDIHKSMDRVRARMPPPRATKLPLPTKNEIVRKVDDDSSNPLPAQAIKPVPSEEEVGTGYEETDKLKPRFDDIMVSLGQHAALALVDSCAAEEMGHLGDPTQRAQVAHERDSLMETLAQFSGLLQKFEAKLGEIEREIKTVEAMIDPESY